jgi:hypothetical protein
MSLVFSGALAATFYTVVLGALWPARDGADFSASILGLIAKSLWLSWLVVAVSYWLDLKVPMLALFGAVVVSLFYQWLRPARNTVLANAPPVILVLIAIGGLCLSYYHGGFFSDYHMIFVTTDALESWNRWAIELSNNTFVPYPAAYPVLFPGMWSLIYKAQGTSDVWIIVKLTLFIIPVIVGGTICLLFSSRLLITALAYTIFSFCFFLHTAHPMFQGNMDMPVAVMCMAAGVAMVVATDRIERREAAADIVVLAALFAGLASITKQAGVTVLLPLFFLIGAGLWRSAIGKLDAAIALFAAVAPLATFMAMFLAQQPDPIGNIADLEAIRKVVGADPLRLAWHQMQSMLPAWTLAILALLAMANVFYLRRLSGWIGILFLALAIAGFFGFAKCCSYDARNGWWIVSLLATSALFTVTRFDPSRGFAFAVIRMPSRYLTTAVVILAVGAALIAQLRISSDDIASSQFHYQEAIMGPHAGPILGKTLRPILNRDDVLLSGVQTVRWYPGMMKIYAFCNAVNNPCIKRAFNEARGRIFVLIQRHELGGALEYPLLAPLLTPEKLMGSSGGYELYGPFLPVDMQSIK